MSTIIQHADAERVSETTDLATRFPDYCAGPEIAFTAEQEAAFRDLIARALPKSTTGCLHGPDMPCNLIGRAS